MPNLKIAYSPKVEQYFSTNRELVEIAKTDFTECCGYRIKFR